MNARPGPAHPTRLLQSTHRSLELTWRGTDLEGKKRHRFAWICTNDLVKAFGEFGNLRRGSSTRALHGGRSRPTLLPSRSLTARVCLDGRTECPMDSGHDRRSSLREVLLDQAFDLLAQLLDARRRHVDGVTRHSCSLNPSPERLRLDDGRASRWEGGSPAHLRHVALRILGALAVVAILGGSLAFAVKGGARLGSEGPSFPPRAFVLGGWLRLVAVDGRSWGQARGDRGESESQSGVGVGVGDSVSLV